MRKENIIIVIAEALKTQNEKTFHRRGLIFNIVALFRQSHIDKNKEEEIHLDLTLFH